MRGAKWLFDFLGVIATTLAIGSLIARLFQVGLGPVFGQAIESYRAIVHPVMAWLLGWPHAFWTWWHVPDWLKDAYALSFIIAGAQAKGQDAAEREDTKPGPITLTAVALVWGATGISYFQLFLYSSAFIPELKNYLNGNGLDAEKNPFGYMIVYTAFYLLAGLGGALVFFALDSLAHAA